MCYERRRAEACVDESAHHFFFLESLSEPADRDADAPHTVLIVDVGHMAWYETHKNTHTHPHTHIHIHIHSSEH